MESRLLLIGSLLALTLTLAFHQWPNTTVAAQGPMMNQTLD
jgi:hypothetical protein